MYWNYGVALTGKLPQGVPPGAIFTTLDMDVADAVHAGECRFPTEDEEAIARSLSVGNTAASRWEGSLSSGRAVLIEPQESRQKRLTGALTPEERDNVVYLVGP